MGQITSSTQAPRRIGLIINPRSHANKTKPADFTAVLARHPEVQAASPDGLPELHKTLAQFAADGVTLLIVCGGDGTLRDVISAMPHAYPDDMPEIAILSAGNTNLAARVLGSAGSDSAALEKILIAAAQNRLTRKVCPLLQVSWPDEPARDPIFGFLFGAASFTEVKRTANAAVRGGGLRHGAEVAATVTLTALRAILGRDPAIKQGWPMTLTVGDRPAIDGQRMLVMATTLDSLMLGLWPFWGKGQGGIRWLDIDASPRRLVAGLTNMLMRRPKPWMLRGGYRSGRGNALRLMLTQPFILDGEAFEPRSGGVLLSAAASVTVVAP
ncbi:hypothetical protein ACELLULO517_19550 [Acidisoma cellulosilytica]|uniref:DAGKc domain-containing protein n=1 Tax=Acidisoma cellulosilyticum TaxID=2802395 RepID=A0A964E5Y6_9PROT|nr:diacylglycerol kinase family protein [Acidisoma cellulosilyticum]MCB8882453.1 hypothetical protein [Acidisoma cellulosilyticum]